MYVYTTLAMCVIQICMYVSNPIVAWHGAHGKSCTVYTRVLLCGEVLSLVLLCLVYVVNEYRSSGHYTHAKGVEEIFLFLFWSFLFLYSFVIDYLSLSLCIWSFFPIHSNYFVVVFGACCLQLLRLYFDEFHYNATLTLTLHTFFFSQKLNVFFALNIQIVFFFTLIFFFCFTQYLLHIKRTERNFFRFANLLWRQWIN